MWRPTRSEVTMDSPTHLRARERQRRVYRKLAFHTRYVRLLGTRPALDTAACVYITTIHNAHSVIKMFLKRYVTTKLYGGTNNKGVGA